jgi:hypothetical protein
LLVFVVGGWNPSRSIVENGDPESGSAKEDGEDEDTVGREGV